MGGGGGAATLHARALAQPARTLPDKWDSPMARRSATRLPAAGTGSPCVPAAAPGTPLHSCFPRARACSNSEIYNHQALRDTKLAGVDLHSRSDSAVVGYLYQKYGDTNELWNSLDGIFACVIWDERTGYFCAARDPIGICSLYWGRGADGSVWFASEMKALQTKCETIECFPPVRRLRGGAATRPSPRNPQQGGAWARKPARP